jgi:hypothetical protein
MDELSDEFTVEQNKQLEAFTFRVKKNDILSGLNTPRYFGSCVELPTISDMGTDPDRVLTKLKHSVLTELQKKEQGGHQ